MTIPRARERQKQCGENADGQESRWPLIKMKMEVMSRGTDEQLEQSTVAGKNEIVLACDGTNHKDHSGFCGAEDKHKNYTAT